jgi:hypothetical protein
MRIVDEETRRIVMQNRIDALEADNLFENLNNLDEEAELDAEIQRKKRSGTRGDDDEFVIEDQEVEESEEISDSHEPQGDAAPALDEQVEANLFGAQKKSTKSKKQRRDPVSAKGAASIRKTRSQQQKTDGKPHALPKKQDP